MKTRMRQIVSRDLFWAGLLSALVLVFVLLIPQSTQAAHLNKYSKKLMVGESFKLRVVGTSTKVKFKSSNKKVATVTAKGVIRAKKKGKAVITATVGDTKYKCKVTVQTIHSKYRAKVRTLINTQRRSYGLQSLDYNKYLAAAAQTRAKELDQKYSHTRPNNKSWTSAISLKYNYGDYYYELIGNGITSPAGIVNAWMNNSSTKPAIIGKAYRDIGVGYYVADDGTEFWCAIIATKK